MDQLAGLGVLTIRRLSLGAGYTYLMESIAVGDGPVPTGLPLARYYEATGTPPGVWMGAGLACLGDGRGLDPGSVVTEEALFNMLGLCVDPVSGKPCGRRPNTRGSRPPVAGFDLTFSPQKSVSVAWALANRETQASIYACHRRAIGITLAHAEERVLHSRSGTNGILQEAVDGVIAAAFTHYDSRSGDPQLHDHVVVWNRARSRSDGVWRTLDSRGLFKHVVTLSEIYDGVLEDLLTAELGVGWEPRITRGGQLKVEIEGVEDGLLAEFSQRRHEMDAMEDKLTKTFLTEHGRSPSPVEKRGIAQQANLQTRHQKQRRSLAEMTAEWRDRARPHVGEAATWVDSLRHRTDLQASRADEFTEAMLAEVGVVVLDRTAERRSTFTRANLLAEAHRQLRGVRFADHTDRLKAADRIVALAVGQSLLVSAPDIHHVPDGYRQADRTSMLRPADQLLYTTEAILDAEQRLLVDASASPAGY